MALRKLLLIVLLLIVGLPFLAMAIINTPPGRQFISKMATEHTHRLVQLDGHAYVPLIWPFTIRVTRLTVANMEGGREQYMAKIGRMDFSPSLRRRGGEKLHIRRLALIDSEVHIERLEDGRANWKFSPDESVDNENTQGAMASLDKIYLENSTFTYFDAPQQTDIKIDAATEGDHFIFSGTGTHLGKGFDLKGSMQSSCLAEQSDCKIDGVLTVGNTTMHVDGTLAGIAPPLNTNVKLEIKGADAAELFPLFGIALPRTEPYHLTGQLTYEDAVWHFTDFEGSMGESDLSGDISWDTSQARPKLTGMLVSKNLNFQDLGPLVGTAPKQAISAEQKATAAHRETSPFVIPDVPLDISRLEAMDAEVEFTGKKVISADLPLDNFYMKVLLDNRVLKLEPIQFGTANGDITADITVDASQSPPVDHANIRFSNLSLARLLENVGKGLGVEPAEGNIGGTLRFSGTGKSLHQMMGNAHGVSGIGMEGGSISNLLIKLLSLDIARSLGFLLAGDEALPIRCIVSTFDVDQGIMNIDSFIIDTKDTNIKGEGTVNLGNEQLDIKFNPRPKKATALSLRSPISIKGTLKHPDVVIEKGPLAARAGIATGLAALAPVAAVVAFIDRGKGEDADCPALMQQMHEKTGTTRKTDEVPENPKVEEKP